MRGDQDTGADPLSADCCAFACRAMDPLGNLVRFVLLPGNRYDRVGVALLIKGLSFDALLADKAFDSNWIIDEMNARDDHLHIPKTTAKGAAGDRRRDVKMAASRAFRLKFETGLIT